MPSVSPLVALLHLNSHLAEIKTSNRTRSKSFVAVVVVLTWEDAGVQMKRHCFERVAHLNISAVNFPRMNYIRWWCSNKKQQGWLDIVVVFFSGKNKYLTYFFSEHKPELLHIFLLVGGKARDISARCVRKI